MPDARTLHYREADRLQRERARVYHILVDLTARVDARVFIETLADVAGINARDPVGRQQGARVREEWQRLANVLELYLKA
jgi:thiamine monophosphate synthase